MAPKGKSPLRRTAKLGLDQLLGQIVAQATQQGAVQQGPPAGTTTTSAPPSSRPGQARPRDANGDYFVAEGLPQGATTTRPPGPSSYAPSPMRPRDANGDYFVAEGLPAGVTPGTQAAPPQAGPAPTTAAPYPPTGTTTTITLNPLDGYRETPVNGQTAAPGVNGGGSTAPTSVSPISPYRNIGEIFAEQPPADPEGMLQFQLDRLNKIGSFYGLTPEQIAEKQTEALSLFSSAKEDGMSPNEARSLMNQVFASTGSSIIQGYDREALGRDGAPPTNDRNSDVMPGQMQSDANPLSVYGVYTPEQIAAIQGQIGQYVNQYQDRFSQAAGGWQPSAAMRDAYARQAQAIPAVQALEGQAALAQELARVKEQNNYYTQLLQQRSSEASSGTGDVTDEQMNAAAEAARNGG